MVLIVPAATVVFLLEGRGSPMSSMESSTRKNVYSLGGLQRILIE